MSPFKPYPAYKDSGGEWLGEVPVYGMLPQSRRSLAETGRGPKARTDRIKQMIEGLPA